MRTYTTPLKASSVAFDARGIWYGVVQEIISYRLKVLVPRLSGDIIYGPLDVVGMNTDTFQVGDPVMIGFLEGRQDELVVIGRLRTGAVAPITNLDDLADVQTPSPAVGQFLQWDGTKWMAASVTAVGSSSLDDLADVQSASPANNQYLKWNGSYWEPATMNNTRTSTSFADAATANSVREAYRDAVVTFHMEVM
jgi:hypothetical protein